MRIVLCVNALGPQLTGIGRYNLELANRLGGHAAVSGARFLHGGRWIDEPASLLDGNPPALRRNKWQRRVDRFLSRRAMARSLVHGPNYFLPDGVERGVVTMHDLSVFRHPETHPVERLRDFDRRFAATVARAGRIITDSETMRQEIIAHTGLPAERVSAVYLGVSPDYRPRNSAQCAAVLARYGLVHGGYGLAVCAIEPRKRVSELVAAWRRLPAAERERRPLVLAGASGWLNQALMEEIAQARAQGWLRALGYVPEADLPFLYAGAALFVYPSIYEGFGLPPLEAMASGVPAIVSNRSCLPEVTRGAAMLIDPDDADGFTAAIARGLDDDLWRARAIEAGLRVAAGYKWEKCVEETVDVYRALWTEYF